ncbi:uncharacterized protein LOC111242051 isoform X2 [Vigna radiata var. radiata]|uniref:Uncharacterized protein LOC111242051 isoform X2 n=1 Tax=Vigna radiata var. radiata TaxID=3916 RepID=A0A3Q0F4V9_VIGRR|nr:uncharacterized protein LOC111242051 isoform X2 [Vigna radiata var. radiata]
MSQSKHTEIPLLRIPTPTLTKAFIFEMFSATLTLPVLLRTNSVDLCDLVVLVCSGCGAVSVWRCGTVRRGGRRWFRLRVVGRCDCVCCFGAGVCGRAEGAGAADVAAVRGSGSCFNRYTLRRSRIERNEQNLENQEEPMSIRESLTLQEQFHSSTNAKIKFYDDLLWHL